MVRCCGNRCIRQHSAPQRRGSNNSFAAIFVQVRPGLWKRGVAWWRKCEVNLGRKGLTDWRGFCPGIMKLILIRFLIGGISVSTFALLGDLFKPKSFAGLFGAAPSVALATLALSVIVEGKDNAATQSTSMMLSCFALFCYSSCLICTVMHWPMLP